MDATRRQARWAGFLYLLVALIAPIGLIVVPNKLFHGNAAETASAILGLLPIPIVFVNAVNELAALVLLTGTDFVAVLPTPQIEGLADLFVRLHGQGVAVASVFWGLWLLPFGMLVIRSNFIPRVLGFLLMVAGTAYLFDSIVKLVLTRYTALVSELAWPLQACELAIVLWLLIVGAKLSAIGPSGQARTS